MQKIWRESILASVEAGRPITREEACEIGRISDQFLPDLQRAAAQIRDRAFGKTITFSQNVFVPLTNICRDYCKYCTFRKDPGDPQARIMTPEEVLEVVRRGKELGCREVLISLGDKADAFPEVREWLVNRGFRNMFEYLHHICDIVVRKTGLLPHTNAGVLNRHQLERLKPVNASMGIMLENVSDRLCGPGQVHERAPDKKPSRRLRMMKEAGELRIPFTTGILIGIGETWQERVDSLFAIKELHDRYGHIQEIIIQNFRAKPGTPMADSAEPGIRDLILTVCAARLIFRDSLHIQAPPNLNAARLRELIRSGIDDWGGISPLTIDYINPESPWPHREKLKQATELEGCSLRQRLPVYPEFITEEFVDTEILSLIGNYPETGGAFTKSVGAPANSAGIFTKPDGSVSGTCADIAAAQGAEAR